MDITQYNVVWGTRGRSSADSMPLGNGETAVNVWTEENGDCCLYLARSDAWDEEGRLLKLGRVRIGMEPALPAELFRQELDLDTGSVRISAGMGASAVSLRIWVDAHRQVVWGQMESAAPRRVTVDLELWRTSLRTIAPDSREMDSFLAVDGVTDTAKVHPDTVLDGGAERLLWCHRNVASIWKRSLAHQGLSELAVAGKDPLLGRTFGGCIAGDGLIRQSPTRLGSRVPQIECRIAMVTHTAAPCDATRWEPDCAAALDAACVGNRAAQWQAHAAWWHARFADHYISITGDAAAPKVSQGYALHRFMLLSSGRGAYPIKFNGSLFTVDSREPAEVFDADYRRWGGAYWFQNTRLAYWPMLMAGDDDCLKPLFDMYWNLLPMALERTRIWYGHGGAFFPETLTFWGTYRFRDYGYVRNDAPAGEVLNKYIGRYWDGGLELLAMHIDAHAFRPSDTFWTGRVLPLARAVLAFFEEHYPIRDGYGHLHVAPSQACETWQKATNPTPVIAGLRWCLEQLLSDAAPGIPDEDRARWSAFLAIVPPVPTRCIPHTRRGTILPAAEYDELANCENPELYAVFPYRLFGLFRPGIDTAHAAYEMRLFRKSGGWQQDAIQSALLGLGDEAARCVKENFLECHGGSRFPAFWGPNYDWIPDMDHGSVACVALQRMLVQYDGDALLLLPAWPKAWNADFRLHAPRNTIVEGRVENGNIVRLAVTPPEREKDVRIHGAPQSV